MATEQFDTPEGLPLRHRRYAAPPRRGPLLWLAPFVCLLLLLAPPAAAQKVILHGPCLHSDDGHPERDADGVKNGVSVWKAGPVHVVARRFEVNCWGDDNYNLLVVQPGAVVKIAGSVIRLHDDGRVPKDNPFVKKPGWKPEKFTLGNRNMQGAALHPMTGELWTHEHGPQGGDEVNIIRAGVNYGWPVITYGRNYGIGTKIGEGTEKEGMAQPLHKWVPSIAPSGMAFYTGDKFPRWRGNLFVGALRDRMLVRLVVDGKQVLKEERLLRNAIGRIRDVRTGPDGFLYLLNDDSDAALYRLEPAG